MMTSSPPSASSTSRDSWLLASCIRTAAAFDVSSSRIRLYRISEKRGCCLRRIGVIFVTAYAPAALPPSDDVADLTSDNVKASNT